MILALVVFGSLERLAVVNYLADAITTLVLLGAGLVVFRIFKERYLFFWISAWCPYLLYRLLLDRAGEQGYPPTTVALTYTAFLISNALFAASVFDYLQRKQWFKIVAGCTAAAIVLSIVRAYWFPQSDLIEAAVQILYRVGTFAAALQLASYNRGRHQLSPWFMAGILVFVHIDFNIASPHTHSGFDTLVETVLGLSMLVLLLDESRSRTQRLDLVRDIINVTAGQDARLVMQGAMVRFQRYMRAKAAWFRVLAGETLEMQAYVGLSDEFVSERLRIPVNSILRQQVQEHEVPAILHKEAAEPDLQFFFQSEQFDHIILIPLRGKTSVIGVIAIGMPKQRRYKKDELLFLSAVAKQLGIAFENRNLLSRILRSQKQWANTFDALPDPVLVHDENYTIIKVNRALLNKVSRSPESVVGKTCTTILPHFESQWINCPYCEGHAGEFRDAPDPCFGGYSIVSTTSYSDEDGNSGGTVHIIRDTTSRRAAEERYRTLFDQVQEGVFVSTPDGRIVDCNDAFVQLLGYEKRDELMAREITTNFYANPADREIFVKKMMEDGLVKNFEVKLRRQDGSIVTALENSYASKTASGNIIRYHGVLLDITEQKRAEDEIRRHNRELEALNTTAVLASHSFDLDEVMNLVLRHLTTIFRADTAAVLLIEPETRTLRRCAAFGHHSELGSNLPEIRIPEVYWQRLIDLHLEIVTERDRGQLPPEFMAFVEAEDLHSWAWVIMWSGNKAVGVVGVSSREAAAFSERDCGLLIALGRQLANSIEKVRLYEETSKAYDHLRRTQEQLLQSEKMSAVGQLISGVAHELNNPLTAILGYAQLLEGEELSEHSREYVSKLFKQAQRTQRVVQNLLSFARQRKPAKLPVDLRRIVEDTLALRDYDLNLHNVEVVRQFDSSIPAVVADAHQLEQVFLNIINNAVDAMLEHARGGRLEVKVGAEGTLAFVRVHDSGPGIREVNRIFDPFYTTKAVGKGTGLGLSICYGIIKEHGGDIRAFNHPDGGAVLEVLLPTGGAPPPEEKEATSRHRVPLQGRVLLIDDEEAVLEFERDVLIGAGAKTLCARSGEEAIELLGRESFDAILVDSSMPGKNSGTDVVNWIAQHRPEALSGVVLAFSSLNDAEARRLVEEKGIQHISKPFEVSDLITIMSRVVHARQSAASTHN
jgi:two-component system NtrC family sensor kinase